jgi:hypothetical protein
MSKKGWASPQNTKVGPQSAPKAQNSNPAPSKTNNDSTLCRHPQNAGKFVDSRHEKGPEDGLN